MNKTQLNDLIIILESCSRIRSKSGIQFNQLQLTLHKLVMYRHQHGDNSLTKFIHNWLWDINGGYENKEFNKLLANITLENIIMFKLENL